MPMIHFVFRYFSINTYTYAFPRINIIRLPISLQKCLSDDQIRILHSYKENLHNDRADIVRRKYEKAWSRLSKEVNKNSRQCWRDSIWYFYCIYPVPAYLHIPTIVVIFAWFTTIL
jgi:hypothetical protein